MGDVRRGTGLYWLVEWSVCVGLLMLCLLADGVFVCLCLCFCSPVYQCVVVCCV
jgi:hypothetical protein